jgi:hypothetical protein
MFSYSPSPLVARFTTLAQRHLSEQVVALYLRGSAARDEWVPGLSDIDLYMVVRDDTLGDTFSRELFQRNLNTIVSETSRRWPRETPSIRVVPLSHLSTNPVGSFLTGVDAQLLLGSDVLGRIPKPNPSDLSRFGVEEFERFSSYWARRADKGSFSGTPFEEAAYQQYVVLKLAQTALLAKGVLEVRKEEIADAFTKQFSTFSLSSIVDQAQRLRLAWPKPSRGEMRSFVREATPFPQALRNHLSPKD